MQIVETIMGKFNRARLSNLKKLYKQAVKDKADSFGEIVVPTVAPVLWQTDFAKYMIEFLDIQFDKY